MTPSDIKPGERVKDVHYTEDTVSVDLIDGRTITVPLVWYLGCYMPRQNSA